MLPKKLFSELARTALDDPHHLSRAFESLFRAMATGDLFGAHKIRQFNGHLFEDATVFDLNDDERRILADASEADWQYVEPSIMGTLFARGLDPDQLAALGAQFTDRDDIVTIVEPVLMAPLRREWAALKASLLSRTKQDKDGADKAATSSGSDREPSRLAARARDGKGKGIEPLYQTRIRGHQAQNRACCNPLQICDLHKCHLEELVLARTRQ